MKKHDKTTRLDYRQNYALRLRDKTTRGIDNENKRGKMGGNKEDIQQQNRGGHEKQRAERDSETQNRAVVEKG